MVLRDVKVLTLDHMLDMANDQVHWLKIDVEGFEDAVISSWKTSKRRPWIIVIESVNPVTKQKNVREYRKSLVQKGYSFVYFDGLNDFYVHQDHEDLIEHFSAPPNVFDQFVFAEISIFCHLANVRRRSDAARLHAEIANTRAAKVEKVDAVNLANSLRSEISSLQRQIDLVRPSTSWKITGPVRALKSRILWFARGSASWIQFKPGSRPHRVVRQTAISTARLGQPRLASLVKNRFPMAREKLRRMVIGASQPNSSINPTNANTTLPFNEIVSPAKSIVFDNSILSARGILKELRAAQVNIRKS